MKFLLPIKIFNLMKQILLISKFPSKDGKFTYQNLLLTLEEDSCTSQLLKADQAYSLTAQCIRKEIIDSNTTLYEI